MKYLKKFNESEIFNGSRFHYNRIGSEKNQVLPERVDYSYHCNDCGFEFVVYQPQEFCNICESENIVKSE